MEYNSQLKCLYYPFSRLLNTDILKYYLLVYDSITFIDEVEDELWRKYLLKNMTPNDSIFHSYESLSDDYLSLEDKGVVNIVSPQKLRAKESILVAYATKADLYDKRFLQIASQPYKFELPTIPLKKYGLEPKDRPTWQAFKGKIASPLLQDNDFLNDELWNSHILCPGNDDLAWTLSYEAGSAAVINFYLEASQELGLTPVTTSELHHELVLRKVKRSFSERCDQIELIDDSDKRRYRAISLSTEVIGLLSNLFPPEYLKNVTISEIMKFRRETEEIRAVFMKEINSQLRNIDSAPDTINYEKHVISCLQNLGQLFKKKEQELLNLRDKVMPEFAKAALFGTVAGGGFSSLVALLPHAPGGLLAASAITIPGALCKTAIDLWSEYRKIKRDQSTSITYLSKLSNFTK